MREIQQLLSEHTIFASFNADEIQQLAAIAEKVEFAAGEGIFNEDDPGDTMYLVAFGAVDLFAYLADNIEQTILTVRAGGVVGALSLIDQGPRPINARAAEMTKAYAFQREALNTLIGTQPDLGLKIYQLLSNLLGQRLRVAIANLRQNIEWTLQVSGVATLDIRQLITDRVEISIELVNGNQITGTILKAEAHQTGFELFLTTPEGTIHFIPYHAIVSASLPKGAIKAGSDSLPNL